MQSVAEYFGLADAAELGWCHAVNSTPRLEAACTDPALHVAVGDVQFASDDALPCLAHPWQDIADLDLQTWVEGLSAAGKAMKIDFGSAEAVEPTLELLQRLKPETPVILHANIFDLLNGEGADDTMEPEQFIRLCQQYVPQAVLSIGWSLKREADSDGRMEDMLIQQMADMTIRRLGSANYSLEIRAGYTSTGKGEVERGAALIFDPLPVPPPAVSDGAVAQGNVLQASHLFRRVA